MKLLLSRTFRPSSVQQSMMREQLLHPKRRIMSVSEHIEKLMSRFGMLKHMDAQYYLDSRTPFCSADIGAVTLASTDKALYPAAAFPVLGANYFAFAGKALRIRAFGRITTAATPGNGTFDVYWGSGADANGTIIGSSAAFALTAGQTNLSWMAEFDITCRLTGATGALLCTGEAGFNNAVVASTLQPVMVPASAPASVTVDTTAANIISVQFKRSGSTVETMQLHQLQVIALN